MTQHILSMNAASLARFHASFRGRLLLPGQAGYDTARPVWNAAENARPALIARPESAQGVAQAIRFARAAGLPIAVRGGGHSPAGYGTVERGVVIDLSAMKAIDINPETRLVRLEPGLTWGEVAGALHPHGLAITSGDMGSVGVAGLTQGGGVGWFVRQHGLAVDRLRAVELVTASGELVRASDTEHPELFWALRGAGANFGVITALEFEAHAGGLIYGGALFFDGRDAARMLSDYAQLALRAPDALTTQAILMAAPPAPFIPPHLVGQPVVAVLACWSGDHTAGEAALAPFRALGTPVADLIGPMPYPALFEITAEGATRGLGHAIRSGFFEALPDAAIAALVREVQADLVPGRLVQLRVLGGQLARVPNGATAFSHRDKNFLLMVEQMSPDPADMARAWADTERVWSSVAPFAAGLYSNFVGERDGAGQRQAYAPGTLDRLARLKAQLDPENVFARNLNVRPAVGEAALA